MKYFHLILDESFDNNYFVVGGIVTTNDMLVEDAIYKIRKKISKNKSIKDKQKQKILNEIKDHVLSGNLANLKNIFFDVIKEDKDSMFIGAYVENIKTIPFEIKYFTCLKEILKYIKLNMKNINIKISYDNLPKIIFDDFSQKDKLEENFEKLKKEYSINSIEAHISHSNKKIQGADLAVGLIRRIVNKEVESNEHFIILHSKNFQHQFYGYDDQSQEFNY